MISPQIIALISISILSTIYTIYSSFFAIKIIKIWDIKNGSELQINLERKTYLISTIQFWILLISAFSLFLFIFEIDRLCNFITGAMCGFGTLNANKFGWFLIFVKFLCSILSGTWLMLNYIDNRFENYPIIKEKYFLLILVTPFFIIESILTFLFFLNIRPEIIVSCCGSILNDLKQPNIESKNFFEFNKKHLLFIYILSTTLNLISLYSVFTEKKKIFFTGFSNIVSIAITILFFVFFVSPYIYEMPYHYCPFCILKFEYNRIGYLFYFLILFSAILSFTIFFISIILKRKKELLNFENYLKKLSKFNFFIILIQITFFTIVILFSNMKLSY